ncbi:MAG: type II toxin-antitoxin system RelE/ParE family toxin [Alphaproteobacteria bacterium]|jgi:proteic killer suppression protein|nr:type II toxin-antitoxin system RelE/ParE family toxin [Alphaproteobacteria bacterium]
MDFRSIGHQGLRRLIVGNDSRGINPGLVSRLRRILTALVLAQNVENIVGPPGWRIHQLKGDRTGTWSVSVSGNWRLTFRMLDGDIIDLDLEDYH